MKITDTARDDLAAIWVYIAADSDALADRFIDEIETCFFPLLDYPEGGADRSALAPGIRVTFCRKYAIYYTHSRENVTILRVVHGAQDVAALFRDL